MGSVSIRVQKRTYTPHSDLEFRTYNNL